MKLSFRSADWKRVIFCYVIYVLIGLFLFLPWGFDWYWNRYLADSNVIWVLLILISFEFLITILVCSFVSLKPEQKDEDEHDEQDGEEEEDQVKKSNENGVDPVDIETPRAFKDGRRTKNRSEEEKEFLDSIGVIIPCHKSAGVIQATLRGVLHHFKPEHVIVMDNGNQEHPIDNTLDKVREISHEILYKWVSIGHKGISLVLGNRLLPDTVKYVLLIDDDVLLPRSMVFDRSYFDNDKHDQVSAISYAIAGCGPDGTPESMNIVQQLQDFEFKFSDTFRVFMSDYSTVLFAHGAIGLWRRDRFYEIYESHPGLPIGEDGWAGRLNLQRGYTMAHDSGPLIRTEVPANLIPCQWYSWMYKICWCWKKEEPASTASDTAGTTNTNQDDDLGDDHERKVVIPGFGSPDLFNQRARRWDMNAPRRTWCHLKLFVLYGWNQFSRQNPFKALLFNLVIRFTFFRGFWALFKALFWAGYIASVVLRSTLYWALLGVVVIYLLQVIKYNIINYVIWRKRKDLQVKLKILFLMPIYRSVSFEI